MRRFAFLTAAGITFVALFFAGFAVFAPDPLDDSVPVIALSVPDERGQAAGRLASMSFSAIAPTEVPAREPIVLDPASFDTLFAASLSADELTDGTLATTTTSSSTTTSIAPGSTTSTRPSTTTTRPPTTTTPTTTTTTSSTSTTTTTTTSTSTTTTTTSTSTTTTTTTTSTIPSSGPLSESEMRELAGRFFPAEEVDKAVLVAWCESKYDPEAYNPAGPFGGLYQHLVNYWDARAAAAGYPGASIFNAEANTAASHLLWSSNGWQPWPYCSAWADGQLGG